LQYEELGKYMVSRAKRVGEDRLIKKYPNRRLYDTQTSAYVTLSDIKNLVMSGEAFRVVDAKTEDDLTRSILLQIILEEEAGGSPVFSTQMLSQIIRFYGNSMQGLMGNYLEKTMQSFVDIHNKLGDQSKGMGAGSSPEAWAQMMNIQNPLMQGLMGSYMESSKDLFLKMQEQMQGSQNIFGNFPFSPATAKTDKE
jgi:polyhydroxyalkanoate synthesis repressor PhaR